MLAKVVRKALRHATLSIAGRIPVRIPTRMVRFFCGHHMETHEAPAFRRTLRMLRNHFEFIPMREAVDLVRSGDPPDGRFVTFSFDDGFLDNFDLIAPILDEHGARACFFVATNFIECDECYRRWFLETRAHYGPSKRPMTWEMLRILTEAGFEVGAHTADHLRLSDIDQVQATQQVLASKEAIEARLEMPCEYFAWPYGRASDLPSALLPLLREIFVLSSPLCAAGRPSPSGAPRSIGITSNRRGQHPTYGSSH